VGEAIEQKCDVQGKKLPETQEEFKAKAARYKKRWSMQLSGQMVELPSAPGPKSVGEFGGLYGYLEAFCVLQPARTNPANFGPGALERRSSSRQALFSSKRAAAKRFSMTA
jgi:hypothetical protein